MSVTEDMQVAWFEREDHINKVISDDGRVQQFNTHNAGQ